MQEVSRVNLLSKRLCALVLFVLGALPVRRVQEVRLVPLLHRLVHSRRTIHPTGHQNHRAVTESGPEGQIYYSTEFVEYTRETDV